MSISLAPGDPQQCEHSWSRQNTSRMALLMKCKPNRKNPVPGEHLAHGITNKRLLLAFTPNREKQVANLG